MQWWTSPVDHARERAALDLALLIVGMISLVLELASWKEEQPFIVGMVARRHYLAIWSVMLALPLM